MCPHCQIPNTAIKKKGFFKRLTGHAPRIQRYQCHGCSRTFSDQTGCLGFRERKSHLNQPLYRLLCSGMSQRRCAEILGLSRRTVARKVIRFGYHCRALNAQERATIPPDETACIVFDEMETFEHSKCKPLSIALAVTQDRRRIISVHTSSMPAKGRLADIARRRYGIRRDERAKGLRLLMGDIQSAGLAPKIFKSDQCPRYPTAVAKAFPAAVHETYKGRRGCVVGQGELNAGGFDPLFSLNHTAAMYRDNLKRLARRTWCTTKRPDRLQDLLDMYATYHNAKLISPRQRVNLRPGPIR
jgi:transposase-like protein